MATPMLEQYLELKRQYPDCILLFRLGDFYEGFSEDAKTLSRAIGLTLTGRGEGENRVPMAGIPHHALPNYLPKLIKAGYKVAIADQMEEPKPGQIVKREVTKVISAGTIIDENTLDSSDNNYLASLYVETKRGVKFWGLSFADISTGEFKVAEFVSKSPTLTRELLVELFRIRAAEIIIPKSLQGEVATLLPNLNTQVFDDSNYFVNDLKKELLIGLKVINFKAFGVENLNAGLIAAGKLYEYLLANRKSALPHITKLSLLSAQDQMLLDEATIRNLELLYPLREGNEQYTLYAVLNKAQTPMGQRKLRQWLLRPLNKTELINHRLEAVKQIIAHPELGNVITGSLSEVTDLERALARITGKSANARDLIFIKNGLTQGISIFNTILKVPEARTLQTWIPEASLFNELASSVIDIVEKAIKPDPALTITEGDIIRTGFSDDLDKIKLEAQSGKDYIQALETSEIQKTGINSLKVGYNRVFGYYIEVSKVHTSKVPENYIRKQTTANAERYITPELKEWEEKVLGASEKTNLLEYQLFEKIRVQVLQQIKPMQEIFDAIANIDVLNNFARLAVQNNYVAAELSDDPTVITEIVEGRHPVVESFLSSTFVANSINFDIDTQQLIILTGPNMSGKSTYIRQIALIFLMAQIGSLVPAKSAKFAVTDRIFTRVGASDNLAGGESTFMVEMSETANILNNATERSLVILDEVGRGTSTYDGVAIAWAIVEMLVKVIKARTLFATHYHELLLLEDMLSGVKNYNVQVIEAEGKVAFMHKIVKGGIDKSYGIHVAELAGVPTSVVARAQRVLIQLQNRSVKSIVDKQMQQQATQYDLMSTPTEANSKLREFITQLAQLDTNNLSPMQALTKLAEIKESAHELD